MYDDRRSQVLRYDVRNLATAWGTTAVAVLFLGYALKVSDLYSRAAVMMWFGLAPTVLAAWRVIVRTGLTQARTLGYNIRRVAIVGASEQGMQVARAVSGAPWMRAWPSHSATRHSHGSRSGN